MEPNLLQAAQNHHDFWYLNEGDTVYDVGCNVGGFFSSYLEKNCKVIGFEPIPNVYKKCVLTYPDIEIYKAALGNSTGIKKVNVFNAWTLLPEDTQGIDRALEYKDTEAFDVIYFKLDDWMDSSPKPEPDFIKLDVDGDEYGFLKGATNTILKYKPVIMIELSYLPALKGDNCEEMIRYIYGLGYKVSPISHFQPIDNWMMVMDQFPYLSSFDVLLFPNA